MKLSTCRYYLSELGRGVCEEFVFAAFGGFAIGVTASFLILMGSEWHLSSFESVTPTKKQNVVIRDTHNG